MSFTAQDVKALREKTGCGMMDCKKALTEANGDMDAAVDFLREQGLAKQAKKASRIAAEGIAYALTNDTNTCGVVIEVNSETDFVAKNDDFKNFVDICAKTVMAQNPADVDALKECKAEGTEMTVAELLQEKVLTIGENLQIRRFERFEAPCIGYVHAGGKIGVIVTFDTDVDTKNDAFVACGKDVAMQIAALNTQFLNADGVPTETLEHEKKIMREQLLNEGKPEQIIEKILIGKVQKFYKENCLVDQEFVKNNDMSIKQYVDSVAKELGGSIAITGFVRYEKGDGIEKRQDDFAAEVANMVK